MFLFFSKFSDFFETVNSLIYPSLNTVKCNKFCVASSYCKQIQRLIVTRWKYVINGRTTVVGLGSQLQCPFIGVIMWEAPGGSVQASTTFRRSYCPRDWRMFRFLERFAQAIVAKRKQGSCLEKEIMQGTMPGARRRGRPRTAWIDYIKTWTDSL